MATYAVCECGFEEKVEDDVEFGLVEDYHHWRMGRRYVQGVKKIKGHKMKIEHRNVSGGF